ncbi:DUF5674 family protein [Candidatus Dependentiae bacterium]|nr:DUF5674 family protein [Candidatus Dependentiae bacterium]
MQLIRDQISIVDLKKMSEKMFSGLVKAVVDVDQNIMMVDAAMHADQEECLLEEYDARQENLWGINLYPDRYGTEDFIEFDSMINIRPGQGNCSRSVDNLMIQHAIRKIVNKLVVP